MNISPQLFSKDHEALMGRVLRNGEYSILRMVGQGGMGLVYLASHVSFSFPLVLKQVQADQPLPESVRIELDYLLQGGDITHRVLEGKMQSGDLPTSGGEYTDRFLREALFLARLQHPAIPTLYDYFLEDGYWYLVMDYIPGTTLNLYLHQKSPLSCLEALDYAIQLCDVLDYLHSQVPAVIFRDLKPANVMLMPNGMLMLIDFGIARYFKDQQACDSSDFGSPGYAPPEQYLGQGQTDARSDLYSLGVMLHEMISGISPVEAPFEELCALQQAAVAASPLVSALVRLATCVEPAHRFQTALIFSYALERVFRLEERWSCQQRLSLATVPLPRLSQTGAKRSFSASNAAHSANAADSGFRISSKSALRSESNALPFHLPTLDQRQQNRQVFHHVRQQYLTQEHMASVDESPPHRVASAPAPLTEKKESTVWLATKWHRMMKLTFMLAVLFCYVLISLLSYVRIAKHFDMIVNVRSAHPTASSTVNDSAAQAYWQVLPSLPAAQADNTVVYVTLQGRAYLYMSGGYRGGAAPEYNRALYRYDINAAHWETLTLDHFPGMVNNAAAVDEQGDIFFTAGYSSDIYQVASLLYMYEPAKGKLHIISPPTQLPLGFGGSMLADQEGHLYLSQGFMKAGEAHAQAESGWYRYDIASAIWHALSPLPVGLGYTVLTTDSDGNLLLLGGATDAGQQHPQSSVYRYNVELNDWEQLPVKLPQPLSGAASCAVGPAMLAIIGGYDATLARGRAQAWLFNQHTLKWSLLPALPVGGSVLGAAACDRHGHLYLVRGADKPDYPTPDFWELIIPQEDNATTRYIDH